MLKGLTHVAVAVTDLERSLAFYNKIPGIEEQFRLDAEDGTPWLVYLRVAPLQFIELFPKAKHPHEPTTNAGLVHFCLEVDDIEAMHCEVVRTGIVPRSEPKMGGDGSRQFWIDDPDGNPIEFHQFTKNSMQLDRGVDK
jgi:catechol 2,3-dioxygenase-like lactoylglutathione lyase family enzyme